MVVSIRDSRAIAILDNLIVGSLWLLALFFIAKVDNTIWELWLILALASIVLGSRVNKIL